MVFVKTSLGCDVIKRVARIVLESLSNYKKNQHWSQTVLNINAFHYNDLRIWSFGPKFCVAGLHEYVSILAFVSLNVL